MIDITTLTIVLAITIAFCIPFILSHQKKKKHEQSLVKTLMAKAAENHMTISTYDIWRRSYAIGVDPGQSKLIYIKFSPQVQETVIDLKTAKRVSIYREEKEIGTGKEKEKIVERLALTLTSADARLASNSLEFYNSEENMGMMGEPLLIQKWHDIVKGALGQDLQKPIVSERI